MRITALFVLLAGCATTIESEWKSPDLRTAKINTVAVFGLYGSPTARLAFEGKLTEGLLAKGVNAKPGYDFIKPDEKPDQAEIVAKMKQVGIDAVLITHVVDRKIETKTQSTPLYTTAWTPMYATGWYGYYGNYYGSYAAPVSVGPSVTTTTEETTYFVDTILYLVDQNQEPVYANRSNTTRSRADKFAGDISAHVASFLAKEHVATRN